MGRSHWAFHTQGARSSATDCVSKMTCSMYITNIGCTVVSAKEMQMETIYMWHEYKNDRPSSMEQCATEVAASRVCCPKFDCMELIREFLSQLAH